MHHAARGPLRRRLVAATLVAGLSLGPWTAAAEAVRIEVALAPLRNGASIVAVDVRQSVSGVPGRAGRALFQVPVRVATTPGQAYGEGDVRAEDAAGALPLRMSVDPPDTPGPLQWRRFTPLRDTVGMVVLRYQARVEPAEAPRRPGPSYDLRGAAGGFGGAFFSFLLLPPDLPESVDFGLHWDLAGLPAGALGASTRGVGDLATRIAADEITTVFLLAGELGRWESPDSALHVFWIGQPPFDARRAAAWTAESLAALRRLFAEPEQRPYYLLMRPFQLPRDGGGATRNGFMLEYGTGSMSLAARQFMFTHEMVHHFVGSLEGDSSATAWFGEGLAEFYKVQAPLRAGLVAPADYAAEIGTMTNAYYMSAYVDRPVGDLARLRWRDRGAQAIPYNRGFMYFARLDAQLRASSDGVRSLDDLVRDMRSSQRDGHGYGEATWRALLRRDLGQPGVDELDAMLQGRLLVPPVDAFGPCLQRHHRRVRRPTLGFDEYSLLVTPRIVGGLDADSAAYRAGLREGDEILDYAGARPRIAHSAPLVVLEPMLRLRVRGSGNVRAIAIPTRGPRVEEYYWTLRSAPHPGSCAR